MKKLAATLAIGALATVAAPASGEPEPVRAKYDVYFGGLHILSAESDFISGADGYTLTARSKIEGVLSVFWDWRGETRSRGRFIAGRAIPTRHENIGWLDDETRRVELDYDATGEIATIRVDPPLDPEEVTELPEDAERGTVDPLSVIAELSRALDTGGSCSGAFAVFDGRRRYDLTITDQGTVRLPATEYSMFSGEATACGVEYVLLGGERRRKSRYVKTARDRIVYVARPLPDFPPLPVALKIETDFGTLMAHLTALSRPVTQAARE